MKKGLLSTFDRLMVAAAFAEEGEQETALEFLQEEKNSNTSTVKTVDLRKAQTAQASH